MAYGDDFSGIVTGQPVDAEHVYDLYVQLSGTGLVDGQPKRGFASVAAFLDDLDTQIQEFPEKVEGGSPTTTYTAIDDVDGGGPI